MNETILKKFATAFPGYAPNFQNVVISYIMEPDLSLLPVIFAHEIGHMSGALDEYGPSYHFIYVDLQKLQI
jgi:hypothetical protein